MTNNGFSPLCQGRAAGRKVPAWTLRVEGGILEDSSDHSGGCGSKKKLKASTAAAISPHFHFSEFFDRLTFYLDRGQRGSGGGGPSSGGDVPDEVDVSKVHPLIISLNLLSL